jgi:hypothetical protein
MTRRAEAQFNAQVGNRIGRPIVHRTNRNYTTRQARSRVGGIARGSPSVSSRVVSNYRRQTGQNKSGRGGRISSAARNIDPLQGIYRDLTNKFVQNANEQQAIDAANQDKENDRPWYSDAWNAIGGGMGLIDNGTGFSGSILGRSLDILNRPFYALNEGMQSLAELPEEHQGWSNLGDQLSTFAGGLGRGIEGKDKTGFGDVYEAIKNNPTDVIGQGLSAFEDAHPTGESWLSRGVGLAGEVAIGNKMFELASPAVMNTVRGGFLRTGQVASEDVLRQTMINIAESGGQDLINNSSLMGGNSYLRSNPQILVDRLRGAVGDAFDSAVLTTNGGGQRATRLFGRGPAWAEHVSNVVAEQAREAFVAPFRREVDHLVANAATMTEADVRALVGDSNNFERFWTELTDKLVNEGHIPAGSSVDDALQAIAGGALKETEIRSIASSVTSGIDGEINEVAQRAYADARRPTTRAVGVRVAGREIPLIPVGRAYNWIGTSLGHNVFPSIHTMLNDTVFERSFPGLFSGKLGKARGLGVAGFEAFQEDMRNMARNYTPDQAAELARALEKGNRFAQNPHMQQALDFIRNKYKSIFGDEFAIGARKPSDVAHDNYGHIHLKGGSKDARAAFNNGRAEAYRATGGPGRFTIEAAAAEGLRPETNVFRNLELKYNASRRSMTQAFFRDDLLHGYGVQAADLSDKAARLRRLVEVNSSEISENFRQLLATKPGTKLYLPEEMARIAKKFKDMSSWSTQEWGRFGRSVAKVMSTMKVFLTMPYVGFHVRNMIGDIFMGLIDGVGPDAYADMAKAFTLSETGRTSILRILKDERSLDLTYEELRQLYKDNVDSSFFRTEVGTYNSHTAGSIPRQMGRRVVKGVEGVAEGRELMGRYTHFYAAYKEEAQALWSRGMRDLDRIQQRALDAAIWRVNQYKFDYSALMPWEQALKTTVFPFYTYLRKALPTLVENMLTNPAYFASLNRFMQYNDGSAADAFNSDNIPQWIRDIGYGIVGGDKNEPWALTADVLPMGSLDILGSQGGAELASNLLQNASPLLQAIPELASGRDSFTGAPVNTDILPYIFSQLPVGQDVVDEFTNPGNKGWAERLLTDRLLGGGISARHITSQQQQYQQNQNRDEAIDIPLRNYNYSQDTYYISVTDNFTYRINNKYTGKTVGEYRTPTEAINAARQLPGGTNERPYVSPYIPPTMADAQAAQTAGYHPYSSD